MDLISFDFYDPGSGTVEPQVCRQRCEQYLYPKLQAHRRVMLVPYTAVCDPSCPCHSLS